MTDYSTQSLASSSPGSSMELSNTEKKDYGTMDHSPHSRKKQQFKYIPVEVVTILFFTQTYLMLAYVQFYLHDRATREYDNSHIGNVTIRDNSSDLIRENAIQAKATSYLIVVMVCNIIPCVVPVLFVGALSDSFGRKIPMYMSVTGALVFCVNAILVVRFDLNVYLLCVGGVVNGLCGYFGTMQTSVFSIVADITEPGPSRTWRLVIVGTVIAAGNVIGTPIAGIWIDSSGFLDILYFTVSLNIAALFVSLFFIPETLDRKRDVMLSFKENFKLIKDGFDIYLKDTVPNRRKKVLLCLLVFLMTFAGDIAKQVILGLYLLVRPFYWSHTQITLYIAARTVLASLATLLTSRCLARVLTDVQMGILGTISNILGLILTGASINDAMMYIAAIVSVLGDLVAPVIRSFMSKTATSSEQGALFCVVSLCELFSGAILTASAGIIYQATLVVFPGFVFIIFAVLMLVVLGVLIRLSRYTQTASTVHEKTYEVDVDYKPLQNGCSSVGLKEDTSRKC